MKKVQGRLKDTLGAFRVSSRYKKAIAEASDSREFSDPITDLARKLHPGTITLELVERVQVGEGCYYLTFRSVDKEIPPFHPGQFLTLTKRIGTSVLTRAYTICSDVARRESISILIKKMGGPFTECLSSCPIGETFASKIGLGPFYFEPLRDSRNLVVLVGGSGVTPAIAMAYAAKDYHLTILYGVNSEEEILLKDKLESLVGENVRLVYVIKDGGRTVPCEKGFISKEIIAKYMGEDPTFFVCGPKPMLEGMKDALTQLGVARKRLRIEPPSIVVDPSSLPTPKKETYELTLHIGRSIQKIPARYDEPLLTSFERAGILVESACRAGACGHCRVKVMRGEYVYLPSADGRRAADKELNYVHSCCAFPTSDMELLLDIPEVL